MGWEANCRYVSVAFQEFEEKCRYVSEMGRELSGRLWDTMYKEKASRQARITRKRENR